MDIGLIGLGRMGSALARRILTAGHRLRVWNRSAAAADPLVALGALAVADPAGLMDAETVITLLADDRAVDEVWTGRDLINRLDSASLHLNMTSLGLATGQRIAALHAAAGKAYVAAPVFGRPDAAASGELDIIAAGAPEHLSRCEPLFTALGRSWHHAGSEPQQANIVKIARNFLQATIIESLGEAFALVRKNGVAPERFLDILTSTSMNSPAYRNYGRYILEPPALPTFTLALGLKDVELAADAAAHSRVAMPLTALLRTQHMAAVAGGYGDRDWASLGNYVMAQSDDSGSDRG